MKRWVACAALLLGVTPASAETLAIINVRAWTMTERQPVEQATVVISDGRIVSVLAHGPVPAGAKTIDGAGKTVTPSLIDAATQIGLGEIGGVPEEQSATVSKGPLGAAFDLSYAVDENAITIQQARADGLARALLYPDGSAGAPFDGVGAILRLTAEGSRVERPRAAMFASVGADKVAGMGGSRAAGWQLLRNALDEARDYQRLRRQPGTRDQLLNHLDAEALAPLLANNVPLVIATDKLADIKQAIAIARDEKIRVIIFGGAEGWAAATELAAARIPVILDPFEDLPFSYDKIGARRENAAMLGKAGVQIAFSVSAQGIHRSWNAAPAIREGAGYAVAAGLPYADALAAITSAPARIMSLEPQAGTLGPGTSADLVMWDGDPLEASTAPALVLLGGREVSPVTRRTLLRDRYDPRR